jgi:2-alkyl-3-oxoalkanoate reductase
MSPLAVVTGAAGFLGSRFAAALRDREWEVRGVDLAGGPEIVPGDITDPTPWPSLFTGVDLVVHAAAIVAETAGETLTWQVNVAGTRTVLEAAELAGVGRVLHLSSKVVHGTDFQPPADETTPIRMTGNPYTDTKVAAEHQALRIAARGRLPVTIVRPGDVYGPGSQQWTVRALRDLRSPLVALPAGGRGILTPTYVDDLIEGSLTAATHPDGAGEVFHINGGVGVQARTFFRHYTEALGTSLRTAPTPLTRAGATVIARVSAALGNASPVRPETVEYLTHPGTYSVEKARDVLGWEPSVDLDEGMRRTLAWAGRTGLL